MAKKSSNKDKNNGAGVRFLTKDMYINGKKSSKKNKNTLL